MIDILFVDDEENVRRGLGRMLHGQRSVWRMRFAPGAREALAMLEEAPADVVVSDMRMPEMDGATLLHQVRRGWPATVRLVLSGHAEESAMIRALGAAHKCLAKPCPKETLIAAVERAVALRRRLPIDKEPLLLAAAGGLSGPGPVYTALLDVLAKPTLHTDELTAVVKRSDSLCAKLLHAANSGFPSAPTPVANVERAVDLLGVVTLKALAAEDAVESRLPSGVGARTGFAEEQAAAGRAQALIGALGTPHGLSTHDCETAATIVALSSVGYAAACAALQPAGAVGAALARAGREGTPRADALSGLLGAPVEGFGALLLAHWGLPDVLVEGVLCVAEPAASDAPDCRAVGLAHLALALARVAPGASFERGADDPLSALGARLDRRYLDRVGLTPLVEVVARRAVGGNAGAG